MNETLIKTNQSFIQELTSELKKHYYYEFFIDPDKKFVGLLEKLIVNFL